MGLKGITMNTAPETEPHIYAEDDAAIYESIVGTDGVFSIGQKCKATVMSNNQVRVADGVICIGGHFARIPYGDYVDVSIANGQSGRKRNDIIIGKIVSTGTGGIDTITCEVKQGTAATTASDPALTQNNLYAGGKIREIPLYRVRIEGLSIVAVEQLFTVIPTIPQVQEQVTELNSNIIHRAELIKSNLSFPSGMDYITIGNMPIPQGATIKGITMYTDSYKVLCSPYLNGNSVVAVVNSNGSVSGVGIYVSIFYTL